ncbi:MAG TPA: AraC family transcriptional regulator [Bacillales bacterium]
MAKLLIAEEYKGMVVLPNQEIDLAHREAVDRTIMFMRGHLGESIRLDDLAEIAGFSPYHFNRMFRGLTGVPPRQFLSALRLEEGKKLLLATDASVTDIVLNVGYNSFGTFSTRFASSVGMSPFLFRKMNEQMLEAVDQFQHMPKAAPYTESSHVISGRIGKPGSFDGIIFVGLFPKPIPNCRPVAGTVTTNEQVYRMGPVPDGTYYVMSAAFRWSDERRTFLLPRESLRGQASGPVVIRRGQAKGYTDFELRPPHVTDPPILISLPLLLAEQMNRAN